MGISVNNVNPDGLLMDRVHVPSSLQIVLEHFLTDFVKPARLDFSFLVQGAVKYFPITVSMLFLPDFADNVQQASSQILKANVPHLSALIFPIVKPLESQDNAFYVTRTFM